jgi:hypothetical protein
MVLSLLLALLAFQPLAPFPLVPYSPQSSDEDIRCEDCSGSPCLSSYCTSGICEADRTAASLRQDSWTVNLPSPCESGALYRCTTDMQQKRKSCTVVDTASPLGILGAGSAAFTLPGTQLKKLAAAGTVNAGATAAQLQSSRQDNVDAEARRQAEVAAEQARGAALAAFKGVATWGALAPPGPPRKSVEAQDVIDTPTIGRLPADVQRMLLREAEMRTKETRRKARNRYRLTAPLHRRGHTLSMWGGTRFILFGGLDRYGVTHNGLWTWNLIDREWKRVPPVGPQPSARCAAGSHLLSRRVAPALSPCRTSAPCARRVAPMHRGGVVTGIGTWR